MGECNKTKTVRACRPVNLNEKGRSDYNRPIAPAFDFFGLLLEQEGPLKHGRLEE
jgi:hypothetical protein